MPSPFPGMDPYLESSKFWRDVHQSLIYCCRRALNLNLPDGFVASIDERLYVESSGRDIIPDVAVLPRTEVNPSTAGGVAVLAPPRSQTADAPDTLLDYPEETSESYITITPAREPDHIIAAIEVLSPKNKQSGTGRLSYRRKQREFFESGVHLLEIDLLRGGAHTVSVSEERLRARYGNWDYVVCLSRADRPHEYDVWRVNLRDRLPRVLIPLLEGFPDVTLDLQEALDRAYAEGAFGRRLNYRSTPSLPLSDEDAAWAATLLPAAPL